MKLEGVAAIVLAIAGFSSLIVYMVGRHDKAKDPLPKQAAEVALARQSLGIIASSRDALVEDVARLTADMATALSRIESLEKGRAQDAATMRMQAAHVEDQQTEIVGLQRQLAAVIVDRNKLVRYVNDVHLWLDSGAVPPAPTVPDDLADVIPTWIPGDGAEPPNRAADPTA